jgi:hypothetical protein
MRLEPVYDAYSSLHRVASFVTRVLDQQKGKEASDLLEEPAHDALPDVEAHDLDELFGNLGQERLRIVHDSVHRQMTWMPMRYERRPSKNLRGKSLDPIRCGSPWTCKSYVPGSKARLRFESQVVASEFNLRNTASIRTLLVHTHSKTWSLSASREAESWRR